MKNNINFQRITRDNLELASKTQNEIFPDEDGAVFLQVTNSLVLFLKVLYISYL